MSKTIKLPDDLYAELQKRAKLKYLPLSKWIELILREYGL